MNILEGVPQRAMKMIKGLKRLSCEKMLRIETSLPGEEKIWGGSHQCVHISEGKVYTRQSQTLFSGILSNSGKFYNLTL